jgi:hypothetical protein
MRRIAGLFRCVPLLLVFSLLLTCGCPKPQSSSTAPATSKPAEPRASVALRVLIVNEPELVEAVNRLRGEWAERSGGELTATGTNWKDLSAAKTLDADVVVFPSRYLGELCTRNWLRPVRANVLESEKFNAADIFPLVRTEVMKWGGQAMAVPLGVDPSAIKREGTPSAITLLGRAAPNAISNDRIGVLFDDETMKPRITEPAIVDALTRMVEKSSEPASSDKPAPPVLGDSDRLIGASVSSRNAATAFDLIQWLAQADTSTQFARVGKGMLPARVSQASSPSWFAADLSSTDRSDLSKTLIAELTGETSLVVPRIPGIDDYLAALDDAVKSAVGGKTPPAEALQKAAEKWEQITESRGRDAQREAYRKHLGISGK